MRHFLTFFGGDLSTLSGQLSNINSCRKFRLSYVLRSSDYHLTTRTAHLAPRIVIILSSLFRSSCYLAFSPMGKKGADRDRKRQDLVRS